MKLRILPLALVLVVSMTTSAHAGYHLLRQVPLGGDGGWDCLTVDADARRLYIARSNRVMVVDADSGTLIAEIPNTPGVHGVALVPKVGRGFVTTRRGHERGDLRPQDPYQGRKRADRDSAGCDRVRLDIRASLCHECRQQQRDCDRCDNKRSHWHRAPERAA